MNATQIEQRLKEQLPGAQVSVRDLTGTSDHWEVWVISDQFEGKSMINQHRQVKDIFKDVISTGELHALSLKTYTPTQWAARSN